MCLATRTARDGKKKEEELDPTSPKAKKIKKPQKKVEEEPLEPLEEPLEPPGEPPEPPTDKAPTPRKKPTVTRTRRTAAPPTPTLDLDTQISARIQAEFAAYRSGSLSLFLSFVYMSTIFLLSGHRFGSVRVRLYD